MRFDNVAILGLAHVDAPVRVTTAALEARLRPTAVRLGEAPELMSTVMGIEERRFWDEGVQPSAMATVAGERALADAGVERGAVGVLVNTSVCKDYIEPSVAVLVHHGLGLAPGCMSFDVGNACLGFLNGIQIVGNMIERGQVDYGLVVDAEGSRAVVEATLRRLLDPSCDRKRYREQFVTLTLGSGAAAMVLGRSDRAPGGRGHRVLGGVSRTASQHCRLCVGQPDEMITDARPLILHGLELGAETWALAREQLGWDERSLDLMLLHQVSEVALQRTIERLRLDPARIYRLFPWFGNVGPASLPIALSRSRDEGRLAPGARVGLLGIGSGLCCMMMELAW